MVKLFLQHLAVAAALFQGITAAPTPEDVDDALVAPTTDSEDAELVTSGTSTGLFNFADAKSLEVTYQDGKAYGCKCQPGQACWPKTTAWNQLNQTVNGNLLMHIPPAAYCHNTFQSPLGTFSTYDAAKCADVAANWENEEWT